jgi:membrane fusion protein (multidrug efflux system)
MADATLDVPVIQPGRHPVRGFLRFTVRPILLIGVPALLGLVALHIYAATGRMVTTENAYVKARKIAVSSELAGRVLRVAVAENQRVRAGDLLVELDRQSLLAARAAAEAERDVVRQEISTRRAALNRARIDIDAAAETLRYAEGGYIRQVKLATTGSGRAALLDAALHEVEAARQDVRRAQGDVQELISRLGGRANLKTDDHPLVRQAQIKIDWIDAQLLKTRILAPADGVAAKVSLEPGEYVTVGRALFVIIEDSETWIEANLKETQLTHIVAGMRATIVLDAYPDWEFKARVASISPATGAEFSLLPPQNASGNWVKVVQRLPVRLRIEAADGAPSIRAGMTATVSIDTLRERELPPLLEKIINLTGGRQSIK